MLRPTEHDGYAHIQIFRGGKGTTYPVHRLVALAFIPNPHDHPVVNHKDGNGLNNSVENLEWVSPSQNTQHAHDTGLARAKAGTDHPFAKLTEDDVRAIRRMLAEGQHTQREIATTFGVCAMVITDIKKGRTWQDVADVASESDTPRSAAGDSSPTKAVTRDETDWYLAEGAYDGEVWMAIPGYEGYFSVSSLGRIKSETRTVSHSRHGAATYKGKLLRPTQSSGYLVIQLARNGKTKMMRVNQVVALAFIPNPHGHPVVNHKDGNGLNNSVENLEWVSPSQNTQHAHDTGLARAKAGTDHPFAKLTEDDVRAIRRMLAEGQHTQREIATTFGVCAMVITDIKKGRTWQDVT